MFLNNSIAHCAKHQTFSATFSTQFCLSSTIQNEALVSLDIEISFPCLIHHDGEPKMAQLSVRHANVQLFDLIISY